GVEGFRFAKNADRLVLFASVIPNVAHDKQRETAADRAKKGPSVRRYTQQPVRHWDHWLHENPELANTHVIAYSADGTNRVDLTPEAKRDFAIEPHLDVSADGRLVAVIRQSPGADRVLDTSIVLIDLATNKHSQFLPGTNANYDHALISPDGSMLATARTIRSPKVAVRPQIQLIDIASGSERTLGRWDRWPHVEAWTN